MFLAEYPNAKGMHWGAPKIVGKPLLLAGPKKGGYTFVKYLWEDKKRPVFLQAAFWVVFSLFTTKALPVGLADAG